MPPRLGLEVIGPWSLARPVAEALGMAALKYRPGLLSGNDLRDAVKLMRQFTEEPWVILRSRSEVPSFEEALAEVREQPAYFYVLDRRLFYVMGNEPNNPSTACSLERYAELLSDGLRLQKRLDSTGTEITVLPPGLMQDEWEKLSPWLLHPLRSRYPLGAYHIYNTNGLEGIMGWPLGGPCIVDEFGYSGNNPQDRVRLNIQVLRAMPPSVQAVAFFCGPSNNSEWTKFEVSVADAEQYREAMKEENMSETQKILEAELKLLQQECAAEGLDGAALDSIVSVWVLAGGDPLESMRRYLVGTRRLRVTAARLEGLSRAGKAAFQEINDAVKPYLPNP